MSRATVSARTRKGFGDSSSRPRRIRVPGGTPPFVLVVAGLVGGCTGTGERAGVGIGSGPTTAEVRMATAAARTVAVTMEGVDGEVARNVHARLSLAAETCDAPRWRVERLVERAENEAREGLRAFGYYEPASVSVVLDEANGCWHATVAVSPGEPVLIEAVEMRLEGAGSEDDAFAGFLDTVRPAAGDVLNHGVYEDAKRSIERYAAEHGYLEGTFAARRFTVDVAARRADIELVYRPGRRFRFGRLRIERTPFDASLVERLAAYPEGEPYDAGAVVDLSQRLSQSGYFERVDVIPRVESPVADAIPVDISLTPRKRHAFTAGAGITTDVGPRLRLGYENRRATTGGHRWRVGGEGSLIRQSLDAEYRIPHGSSHAEWLTLDAGVVREDTDTSRTDEARVGVSLTRPRWSDWLETRFVSLTYDDFSVGRTRGIARLLTPGVSLATTRYDERNRPLAGHRVHLEVRGSHEAVGSDVSFFRVSGSAGWVRGVSWGGRLLARTELGAMAVDGFNALPPSQRFFTGGDGSVRGYEFVSLGPVDEDGTVVGGRLLAVGSIEYEHPIKGQWSGALFADAGNAFDTGYRNDGMKAGIGFGVRWQSPVGPVRVDLARPLDASQRLRLHLRLGPDL